MIHQLPRPMAMGYDDGMNNTDTLTSFPVATEVALRQDASVIGLVGLAHASSHFSHLLLPLLFPVFMKEFGLSFSELGLVTSVFFVVSGIGQASAGFVVDRFGARPVLFGSFGFFIVACMFASQVTGYGGLLLVAVLAVLPVAVIEVPPLIMASRSNTAGRSKNTTWRSVHTKSCIMIARGRSMSTLRVRAPVASATWKRRNGGNGL